MATRTEHKTQANKPKTTAGLRKMSYTNSHKEKKKRNARAHNNVQKVVHMYAPHAEFYVEKNAFLRCAAWRRNGFES